MIAAAVDQPHRLLRSRVLCGARCLTYLLDFTTTARRSISGFGQQTTWHHDDLTDVFGHPTEEEFHVLSSCKQLPVGDVLPSARFSGNIAVFQ